MFSTANMKSVHIIKSAFFKPHISSHITFQKGQPGKMKRLECEDKVK